MDIVCGSNLCNSENAFEVSMSSNFMRNIFSFIATIGTNANPTFLFIYLNNHVYKSPTNEAKFG